MNEVKAKLSRLPVSSFKVRLLADQIRGKFVSEALDILNFSKKTSGSPNPRADVMKVLYPFALILLRRRVSYPPSRGANNARQLLFFKSL